MFKKGRRFDGPLFLVVLAPTTAPTSRLGLAVGRRVGNAVVRNRVKRLLREAFRQSVEAAALQRDIVIVAKPGLAERTFGEIRNELGARLARALPGVPRLERSPHSPD